MAVDYKHFAFPKGKAKGGERAKLRKREAQEVRRVRELVVERDQGCRACRDTVPHRRAGGRLEMHEIIYRSATRGRPVEERVNTRNCVLLCEHHHHDLHAKRLVVRALDGERGANGSLGWERKGRA
jgi:hypothetical protein